MAYGIQNYPNIDTTDPTNYPNGSIRDAAIGVAPTPVNRLTNGDVQMFFDKIMRLTAIVASNTSDDETNGYQYVQALMKLINQESSGMAELFGAAALTPVRASGVVASVSIGIVTVTPGWLWYNGMYC